MPVAKYADGHTPNKVLKTTEHRQLQIGCTKRLLTELEERRAWFEVIHFRFALTAALQQDHELQRDGAREHRRPQRCTDEQRHTVRPGW